MRQRQLRWMLSAVAAGSLASGAWLLAGDDATPPIITAQPAFSIPFELDRPVTRDDGPAAAQLHVSTDAGRSWQLCQQLPLSSQRFDFQSQGDGEYWFVVRTVDAQGRFWPDAAPPRRPELRVQVDTTRPALSLTARRAGANEVQVAWEAIDAGLSPESFVLEYRVEGDESVWHTVPATRMAQQGTAGRWVGELALQVAAGEVHFRAGVMDAAGNRTTTETSVGRPPDLQPIVEIVDRADQQRGAVPEPNAYPPGMDPLMVNSHRFEIDYDVEHVGAAGVAKVEVWGTRDGGRHWVLLGLDDDRRSPCPVQVDQDGLYGFLVVVENGRGDRGPAPAPGDEPDIWVGVDTQPPRAALTTAEPARGPSGGLAIRWQASDARLAEDGIRLSFAARADGPWTPLATGLSNTGEHVCLFDVRAPEWVYLKLEARDAAGNVTSFATSKPINIASFRTSSASTASRAPIDGDAGSRWYHVLR